MPTPKPAPSLPPAAPHRRAGVFAAAAALLLAAQPLSAAVVTQNMLFTANDRNLWGSGPADAFVVQPQSFGPAWPRIDLAVGGVEEVTTPFGTARFGAEIGARASGRFGFDYGVNVTAGSFDLNYGAQARFITPDTRSADAFAPVTLGSSFAGLAGVPALNGRTGVVETRQTSLQVHAPTVEAYLDMAAELHAFAGARACVVVCYEAGLPSVDFNASRPLIEINRNGSGQLRLLDNVVGANRSVSALGGLVNANLSLPDLNGSSLSTPGGLQGSVVTSTQRDQVLGVNANLAQIAANAVGLPIPLSGKLGPLGYNLLQANAGMALDLRQTLQYTPEAFGQYVFSSDVIPIVNGRQLGATSVIDFRLGDDVSFLTQNVGKISYQPTVRLGGTVRNLTEAVLAGSVGVHALGLDMAGLKLGPLIDQEIRAADLGVIPLFDETFGVGLGSVALPAITLDFNCTQRYGSSEFGTFGVCAESEFLDLLSADNGDGTRSDLIAQRGCSDHRVLEAPTCFFRPNVRQTSAYVTTGAGDRVYVNGRDALSYAAITGGAGSSDDAQRALLQQLGYDPVRPDFVIPAGDPLSSFVPEPGSLPLAGLGVLLALFAGPGARGAARGGPLQRRGLRRCPSSSPTPASISKAWAGSGTGLAKDWFQSTPLWLARL